MSLKFNIWLPLLIVIVILFGIILLLSWWAYKKGQCRRTHYSHNITTTKLGGKILAVLPPASSRSQVTVPPPPPPISEFSISNQNRLNIGTNYHNDHQRLSPIFDQYHHFNGSIITSSTARLSGHKNPMGRSMFMAPPYSAEGPPSYNQAIAIRQFRNSIINRVQPELKTASPVQNP